MSELKELNEIINRISETSSRLEKERILFENRYNSLFLNVCQFLYDPMVVTGLSSKRLKEYSDTTYAFDLFSSEDSKTLEEVLDYFRKNNTGRDCDIEVATDYIADNEEYSEMLCKLLSKELKMGIDAPTLNKVYGDGFIETFDVMLAENYFDNQELVVGKRIILSWKLDGSRMVAECFGDKVELKTRQGQSYGSVPEIEEELKKFPKEYVYDGEVLADSDLEDSEELFRLTQKASRIKGEKRGLVFHIFDMVPIEEFRRGISSEGAEVRKERLKNVFESLNPEDIPHLQFVENLYVGEDLRQILICWENVVKKGGEGVMLNIADAPYECKRTTNLLKVKKHRTADVLVTGVYEGEGECKGTLGGINIVFEHKGARYSCNVGSGFKPEERDYYWHNPEKLIGKIVEIKYFEISQNQEGGFGMRFPVWIRRIREDKQTISMH